MTTALEVAQFLDERLRCLIVPDYPNALNGLQFGNRGAIRRLSAAVDFSLFTLTQAVERGSNLLLVHHGMFWGGAQPVVGARLDRVRLLISSDVAVYAAHLPLDAHEEIGNAALLARELELHHSAPFAHFHGVAVGVAGESDIETADLLSRSDRFARQHGGTARASRFEPGRRSRRWAICTGAGASSDTLHEARGAGIDTLIVGEGPHHTAVEAPEAGIVIIYAGHYATETLGVAAAAAEVSRQFGLPHDFIPAPTGL